ncbi:MAG: hypothetical protein RSB93_04750, partial [Rikenellaceae bacterium]
SVANKIYKKSVIFLRVFMVFAFLAYYGSMTIFQHTHTFVWGTVTHSHPYLPSSQHTHTFAGCQLINLSSNALFTTVVVSLFVWCGVSKFMIRAKYNNHVSCLYSYNSSALRAPPIL